MSHYNRKDHYYQRAKKEGYPARSAYKLMELDQKFHICGEGKTMVDLGSSPGGWLKVLEERGGKIVGIDLLPLQYQPAPCIRFIQGDFCDEGNQQKIRESLDGAADWVLSDMSPNISGVRFRDSLASAELAETALIFSKSILKAGGGLIVKVFPGAELEALKKNIRQHFKRLDVFIPESTRKTSEEIYLVARGYHMQ